jgi:protein-disulfide isomerase
MLRILLVAAVVSTAATLRAADSTVSSSPLGAAANVNGVVIPSAKLDAVVSSRIARIRAQEYEIRLHALDQLIENELLSQEAKKRGIPVSALLQTEVEARVPPTAVSELEAAYAGAEGPLKLLPREEGMRRLSIAMRAGQLNLRRQDYVAQLKAAVRVEQYLEPPRIAINPTSTLSSGPANAPVTIIDFTDYECPFCARARIQLRDMAQRFQPGIRIIYQHLPLTIHSHSLKAAEAVSCAAEQGKLEEMQEQLYAHQHQLSVPDLKAHAASINLDRAVFDPCLDSGKYAASVQRDADLAKQQGIDSTPTIFVNGRLIVDLSEKNIARIVEDERSRLRVAAPVNSATQVKP